MPESDVIIIGAGVAGLSAAKKLREMELTYTLIEASDRIGGRAHSIEIAPSVWFDLGCAWLVGGRTNPFASIAEELGIRLAEDKIELYDEANHRFHRNGVPLTKEERIACLDFYDNSYRAIYAMAERGNDVALSEVVGHEHEFSPPLMCNVAAGWGKDIGQVSTADFASATGELGFQVINGLGNLISAWGADVNVALNTHAEQIAWSGDKVTVETSRGAISGRTALITVSTGILASGSIQFAPKLPNWKLDAIHSLPMGVENKIAIYFDSDVFGDVGIGHYTVWNDNGSSAKVDINGITQNTAAVFVGGNHGIWLENQGREACQSYGLDRLVDIFGSNIRKHVVRTIETAWHSDSRSLGSWSCALPGQAHQRSNLQRPVEECLFFAGEATVYGGQGTCHGAHQSGIEAANEIALTLKNRP